MNIFKKFQENFSLSRNFFLKSILICQMKFLSNFIDRTFFFSNFFNFFKKIKFKKIKFKKNKNLFDTKWRKKNIENLFLLIKTYKSLRKNKVMNEIFLIFINFQILINKNKGFSKNKIFEFFSEKLSKKFQFIQNFFRIYFYFEILFYFISKKKIKIIGLKLKKKIKKFFFEKLLFFFFSIKLNQNLHERWEERKKEKNISFENELKFSFFSKYI
jgi:hypothetical protein